MKTTLTILGVSLLAMFFGTPQIFAQSTVTNAESTDTLAFELGEVVITSTRLPVELKHSTRSIDVLEAGSLQDLSPRSLDDAIQMLSHAHLQRRGVFGMQADIGMRGGTFGQTLVLVDGMRVSDPQTGHHTLHIPVSMGSIQRLELLGGHGSSLLGADAFGGAVNIVTAVNSRMRTLFNVEGGSFGFAGGGIDAVYDLAGIRSSTSVAYRKSDGYREGTDFKHLEFTQLLQGEIAGGTVRMLAGYADKDFGAYDFYSPGRDIPSREHIRSAYASASGRHVLGDLILHSGLSFRQLEDRFVFDSRTPDKYVNEHQTRVYAAELRSMYAVSENATLITGIDACADRIESSNLGDHDRQRLEPHAAVQWSAGSVALDAGLRGSLQSNHEPVYSPSAGAAWMLFDALQLKGSIGSSFRLPTYTDLHYSSPVNKGNPELRPETAWNYEVGVSSRPSRFLDLSLTGYRRDQRDLIDYVQWEAGDPYVATNLTHALIHGLEGSVGIHPASSFLDDIVLKYTAISSEIDTKGAHDTRYALTHPRQKISLLLHGKLPLDVRYGLTAMHADLIKSEDYTTVDISLSKHFGVIDLTLAADNLFDAHIEEIPGLPLPGRWLRLSAQYALQ